MKKINLISQTTLAVSAGLLLTACSSMRHDEPAYSSNTGYNSNDYSSSDQQMKTYDQQRSISESSGAQNVNQLDIPLHEERVNIGKRTVDAGQVTIRKIVTTETVNQPVQLRRERLIIDRGSDNQSLSRQGSSSSSSQSFSSTQGAQKGSEWQPSAATTEQQRSGSPRALEQNEDRAAIATEPAGATTENDSQYQSSSKESSFDQNSSESSRSSAGANANQSGTAFQEQTYTIRLQEEQPVIQKNVVQTGRVTARKTSQTQQQNISEQVRREDVQLDKSGANVEVHGNFNSASGQIAEPSGAERHNLQNNNSSENNRSSFQSSESQKSINDSTREQNLDRGVNENTDSTSGRVPSQGQGAQDLKKQPDQSQP